MCASLYRSVQRPSLRWQALECMPTSAPRPHELRRRLAIVFFFDDLPRAQQNPEQSFSIRAVIHRLDDPEFKVHKGTDHGDLAAMVRLLDVVVDDGGRPSLESLGAQLHFNADIDELAARLKVIFQQIDASPSVLSKLGSKMLLESIQQRLSLSVRTKRPPRPSLYDDARRKEDESLPRQQEYLKSFLRRAKPASTPERQWELL